MDNKISNGNKLARWYHFIWPLLITAGLIGGWYLSTVDLPAQVRENKEVNILQGEKLKNIAKENEAMRVKIDQLITTTNNTLLEVRVMKGILENRKGGE